MKRTLRIVYKAQWNDRITVVGLSEDEVKNTLLEHWTYGDPEDDDDYRLGTHWAEAGEDEGWRIVTCEEYVYIVHGELRGSFEAHETVHVLWRCPLCGTAQLEDVQQADSPPQLCGCGRSERCSEALFEVSW